MEIENYFHEVAKALVGLDTAKLVALFSDDFLFEDTASGEKIRDKATLKSYFDRLFSLPGVSFSDVSFFSFGERGAGQWTWGGVSQSSGEKFEIRGASLFELSENGIVKEIIFYDPRAAFD